jgi:hypothetical protein
MEQVGGEAANLLHAKRKMTDCHFERSEKSFDFLILKSLPDDSKNESKDSFIYLKIVAKPYFYRSNRNLKK